LFQEKIVTKFCACCVAAVALSLSGLFVSAAAPKPAAGKTASDQKAIQGTWQPIKSEMRGSPTPGDVREQRMVFSGDRFKLVEGDKVLIRGTFTLDDSKKPKVMEMRVSEGAGGDAEAPVHGIYELDGDNLKWCAAEPGSAAGPEKFESKGTTNVLLQLKREQPSAKN
jgi:uncharacterized protein (TIGR03067 family)